MKLLITICARGGSKGIPGKNIKVLNGRPLLHYTIDVARELQSEFNCDIGLSTDALSIIDSARSTGLEVQYERPEQLATDTAGKLGVIEHLLLWFEKQKLCKYDFIIDLDVTSPLRTKSDILNALKMLQVDNEAQNIFSVNNANRNPYFNMVEEDGNGYVKLVKQGNFLTRQSAPKVYDLNASFYIFKRSFFEKQLSTINDRSLIYVMPHICFDLDHVADFEYLSYLLSEDKLDFMKLNNVE